MKEQQPDKKKCSQSVKLYFDFIKKKEENIFGSHRTHLSPSEQWIGSPVNKCSP
jgi:hypothetical protein